MEIMIGTLATDTVETHWSRDLIQDTTMADFQIEIECLMVIDQGTILIPLVIFKKGSTAINTEDIMEMAIHQDMVTFPMDLDIICR